MRIAVISDLHIGTHARSDTFQHAPAAFERFLDALEDDHDHIVLLGDVYQCDHGWSPKNSRRELAKARARSTWLTRRLEQPHYTLVHGNHDAILRQEGVPTEIWMGREDPFPTLLIHGDSFDPVIQRAPGVSGLATWASGRIRSAGLRPIAQWLEDRDIEIKGQRLQTPGGPYVRGARERMRREGARRVVMGHTHIPWCHTVAEGIILNSGTCCRGKRMFASVDTITGESRSVPCA